MTGAAAAPSSATVCKSVRDGVAHLTLQREPRNVLDTAMMREVQATLATLAADTSLRALVVRSALKVFSAGVDVGEHIGDSARSMLATFHRLLAALEEFPAPTIALVGGAALGGGLELALACDLRVVAAEARVGQPEIALGVFPPYAALRLGEIAGHGRAARLILGGEAIDGSDAWRQGIADEVAPAAELEAALARLLEPLAVRSASSLRLAKQALRLGRGDRHDRMRDIETLYLDRLVATHDAGEGLRSFLEKRRPIWKHC